MGKKNNFEYIVIGSGPAGSTVALSLAEAKKRVAVIDEKNLGGSHLNTRDIPYLVSLNASHGLSNAIDLPEIRNQNLSFSLPALIAHQFTVVNKISQDLKRDFKNAGITFLSGTANLLDQHTIAVGSKKITADNFILATGSTLKLGNIAGSDADFYLTPESAIQIRRLPKVAVIVGGGSAGLEIANFYAELGCKIIIIEKASRILPREDKEVSEFFTDYLTNTFGATILPNCEVVQIQKTGAHKTVIFRDYRGEKMVHTDCIVLATGSQPVLDYGLENAGVAYNENGIKVNKYFQTSAKNIYAIGDCIGEDSSTERAHYDANLLASNLLTHNKNLANYTGFSRVTKTFPEIATIGTTEEFLIKHRRKYKKAIVQLSKTSISKISGSGFIKLLADKTGHIVGATIVSPQAELMSSEISLAIRHNLTALEIASTPHPIDNYNYIIRLAAKQIVNSKN